MKKYMHIIKKNKYCLILALFILSFYLGRGVCALAKNTGKNTNSTVIVIDPGHGGSDPGKISTSGVMEKDVNLSIAMALKQLFENRGFTVVMTRTTDCDLAPDNSKHPKTDDLTKRTALMSRSNVAVSISIHQNSYHEEAIRGGQVFYYKTSVRGKKLAESLQKRFDYVLGDSNKRQAKANDNYYLLLHVKEPIVIAECGFLSNREEAKKLETEEYQDRLAWTLHMGIMEYLNQN